MWTQLLILIPSPMLAWLISLSKTMCYAFFGPQFILRRALAISVFAMHQESHHTDCLFITSDVDDSCFYGRLIKCCIATGYVECSIFQPTTYFHVWDMCSISSVHLPVMSVYITIYRDRDVIHLFLKIYWWWKNAIPTKTFNCMTHICVSKLTIISSELIVEYS